MITLVDMHAEATSEKVAMGWYLDGRVSAVVGTHTHVQTADERVLPGGTAYITDVGMTGPFDSVIGVDKAAIIQRFLTGIPNRFDSATGDVRLCGVVISVDRQTAQGGGHTQDQCAGRGRRERMKARLLEGKPLAKRIESRGRRRRPRAEGQRESSLASPSYWSATTRRRRSTSQSKERACARVGVASKTIRMPR